MCIKTYNRIAFSFWLIFIEMWHNQIIYMDDRDSQVEQEEQWNYQIITLTSIRELGYVISLIFRQGQCW
jgi:hypothetical protein